MSFRVEFTGRAEREFDAILTWLRERSHAGAQSWLNALEKSVANIASNPHLAPVAPENDDHEPEIRHYLFKTSRGRRYRLLLTIVDQVVYVTNVRGAGQELVGKGELGRPNQ